MRILLGVLSISGIIWSLPMSYRLASRYSIQYRNLIILLGIIIFVGSLVGLCLLLVDRSERKKVREKGLKDDKRRDLNVRRYKRGNYRRT